MSIRRRLLRWRPWLPPGWDTPWRRFWIAVTLLVGVLVFGTTGYVVVGLGPFDALYQTGITISTVGFREVGPADEIDTAYRAFTLVLVLVGTGLIVYTASILLETLFEGTLNAGFRRRRMQRQVNAMSDHVIVAGWGRVGHAIAEYARSHGMAVVAVEQDPDQTVDDVPVVVGDATDDDMLLDAGIERASSLIAALGRDSDNLALTLTARALRADLFIVARITDDRHERKFLRAGADRVVNPYRIGGSRMAAVAFRPHVAEFLDEVIQGEKHDLDIYELPVTPGSPADGAHLGDMIDADNPTAAVIAVREVDGRYTLQPPTSRALAAGEVLIAVGSAAEIQRLNASLTPTRS